MSRAGREMVSGVLRALTRRNPQRAGLLPGSLNDVVGEHHVVIGEDRLDHGHLHTNAC
jgi:hypothetical protein